MVTLAWLIYVLSTNHITAGLSYNAQVHALANANPDRISQLHQSYMLKPASITSSGMFCAGALLQVQLQTAVSQQLSLHQASVAKPASKHETMLASMGQQPAFSHHALITEQP